MLVNLSSVSQVKFALRGGFNACQKICIGQVKLYSLCCHAFVRYPI